MYLATPVINTSTLSHNTSFNFNRRQHEPSPSTSRQNNYRSASSATYNGNPIRGPENNDYEFLEDSYDGPQHTTRERNRTQSVGNRLHKKPPLPVMVKVRAKEFHSSADMLSNEYETSEEYLCGDFESTGMYSAAVPHKKYGDYGSNPSIPHSYSSPGIVAAGRLQRHSPNTIKRLEQLALSDRSLCVPNNKMSFPSNYAVPPPSYQQHTLENQQVGEYDEEDDWSDLHSEETLV